MKPFKAIAASFILTLTCLCSCQDEDFIPAHNIQQPPASRASQAQTSALVQNADGTWTANKRVPLVGKGRIVDDMSYALVSVLGQNNGIDNLLDLSLENYASYDKVIAADLVGNQLASVRDLNHVYAGGQTVGYVYKVTNTGLLTAEVLKGFWISTYLKGELQETKGGNTQGTTLDLNVLSVANNNDKQGISLSTNFEKPFDEVKIGMAGIDASVLQSFSLYYAFVGDNEIKPCTEGSVYFPKSEVNKNETTGLIYSSSKVLTDNNKDNGVTFGTITSLIGLLGLTPEITINTGKDIPVGSEVGFYTSAVNILSLGILDGGMEIVTYDASNVEQEKCSVTSLLGISLLSGGGSQISMITTKPCTQISLIYKEKGIKLSSTTIHYAYVRDPITIDPSSLFSPCNATITGNSYHLLSPTGGNTTWVLLSSPGGTTPSVSGNKITGMTADGDYVLSGTFTPASSEGGLSTDPITQTITITRQTAQADANCNTLISATSNEASVYRPQGGGSFLTLEDFDNPNNLVDGNEDTYATYKNFLSIAANTSIVGIETTKSINQEKQRIKTGFTMQTTNALLGADVLKFFVIKLYDGDQLVANSEADNSTAISANLIGSKGNKVRIGITTDQTFDKIELWTAGVLNLNLTAGYRFYNAYWEPADATCPSADRSEACMELLTPGAHGAAIDYTKTGTEAVAGVGGSFNNLGNLLDGDKSTCATITYTNVIGATSVAVKFEQMPAGTTTGFIVKNPSYLLDLSLLNATKLEVYSAGALVATSTIGGTLGLDVIGYTDRIFLETTPTTEFDEIRITLPEVANATDVIELYGTYVRRDSDGDGIPDCAEDEENPTPSTITNAKAEAEHACVNETTGKADITILVTGGTEGSTYTLHCYNYANSNEQTTQTATLADSKLTATDLPTGDYYISILDAAGTVTLYNGIHAALHPTATTWKTSAATTDWNTWSNWTEGTPWSCTNVTIPSACPRYPVLKQGADNLCNDIHFAPGAEVVNTHYLTYQQAWVELSLNAGRYYMLSAPLKDTYTGDMFVPASLSGNHSTAPTFTELDETSCPENRFSPRIYQRLWNSNAPGRILTGGTLDNKTISPDQTLWTAPFNALAQAYAPGQGFSLRAEKENLATETITFRFPKAHTAYSYFNANNTDTGQSESGITRTGAGRFIYEDDASGTFAFPYTVTLNNQQKGTTFIAGNPFMAHLDIARFLQQNSNITSVKVYDGNANNTLMLIGGQLTGSETGTSHIAPIQAFFVTTATPAATCNITFTEEMLGQSADTPFALPYARSAARSSRSVAPVPPGRNVLRLSASCHGTTAACIVCIRPQASNACRTGEDSKILLDNEATPVLSLFTTAGNEALDIQQTDGNATAIPVGFALKTPGRVYLTLTHAEGEAWKDYTLEDRESGNTYPLSSPEAYIDLGELSTCTGRFYLVKTK